MKVYSTTLDTGESIHYVDRKRWLWSLSVLYPLQPFIGIGLHAATGHEAWLLLPLALAYIAAPIIDWVVGEDTNNPPEVIVPQLEQDRYYRYLTYAVVPLHFSSLVLAAWWAASQDLSWWAFTGLAAVAGITSGLAINTGHELGHKKSRFERTLAKIALAVPAYGHFTLEHNAAIIAMWRRRMIPRVPGWAKVFTDSGGANTGCIPACVGPGKGTAGPSRPVGLEYR
jgi:alkane 1-monooxygenase